MKIIKRIKKHFKKFSGFLKKFLEYFTPTKTAVRGAAYGILGISALLILIPNFQYISSLGILPVIITIVLIALIAILSGLLGNLTIKLVSKIPVILRFAMIVALPIFIFQFGGSLKGRIPLLLYILLFSSFIGGAIWLLARKKWKKFRTSRKIIVAFSGILGLAGLLLVTYWLISPGKEIEMPEIAALKGDYIPEHLQLNDPGSNGHLSVLKISYGSGKDKHRKEYSDDVTIVTDPVDGSFFVDNWKGFSGKLRTWYFGFDLESLPRNAKVWYPDGKGPFPLVLIVHGNHLAQDYSDPGYDYLGELLASRGFIMASVDENFFNGSFTNFFKGLKTENDARGWMLLEHLNLWKKWNADSTSIFFEKIDMQNISLIGHSRGGEAVAHAALFNRLPYYPDNAKVQFDYNFNLKSIVAIAPSDGQYQPSGIRTPLKDVSYFVLHGAHDADVQSYMGMRQYERVSFSPGFDGFKASLYIFNANHGQFNSSWGRKDYGSPGINLINLKQIMPKEEQEKIAKTYISAFLEITLKGKKEYLPVFKDYRTGKNWLPETVYLSRFDKSGMQYISQYAEDLDITTSTHKNGYIETGNLTVWREQLVKLKWGDMETRAAFIGWNNKVNDSLVACYSVSIPEGSLKLKQNSSLFFSLADANEDSNPQTGKKEKENKSNDSTEAKTNNKNSEVEKDSKEEKDKKREPINFSIELVDSKGEVLRFKLSDHALLQPQLKVKLAKLDFMNSAPDSEHLYHFFYFPMARFVKLNNKFSPERIVKINLVFDQTEDGVIILDNLGFL